MINQLTLYYYFNSLGWTTNKIARHFNISPDSVNNVVQEIQQRVKSDMPPTLKELADVKKGDKIRLNGRTYKVLNTDNPKYAICHTGLYRECLSYVDIIAIKNGTYTESERGKASGECKNPRRVRG